MNSSDRLTYIYVARVERDRLVAHLHSKLPGLTDKNHEHICLKALVDIWYQSVPVTQRQIVFLTMYFSILG